MLRGGLEQRDKNKDNENPNRPLSPLRTLARANLAAPETPRGLSQLHCRSTAELRSRAGRDRRYGCLHRLVIASGTVQDCHEAQMDPFARGGGSSAHVSRTDQQQRDPDQLKRSAWTGGGGTCDCRGAGAGQALASGHALPGKKNLGARVAVE